MRNRLRWSAIGVGLSAVLVWLAAAPLVAQVAAGQTGSTAARPATAASWTAPRTPWGDPDLQGNYTNTYENGTPLERPDAFAGRRLEDIKGEELARIRRDIEKRTIGNFQGPIHAPDHWWQDNLSLEKGSQAWFVVDPPDGKIPPMTPEARQRIAARAEARKKSGRGPADSYEDRSLYDRCITRGLPGSMMPAIYGNSYEIVQSPGFVAIRYEMIHEARVIPLDGRPHSAKAIPQDMGEARGRWEGDTLVVETRHFKERSVYRNANPDTLKLTERFTRTAPDKVRWTVTVEDPNTWTRPWSFSMPLTADHTPLPSYECHEGNYGLKNILSAARAEEREAARTGGRVPSAPADDPGQSSAPAEGR